MVVHVYYIEVTTVVWSGVGGTANGREVRVDGKQESMEAAVE